MWMLLLIPGLAGAVVLGLWCFRVAFSLAPPKELGNGPAGLPPDKSAEPRLK